VAGAGRGLNFQKLAVEKEQLRQAKSREPKAVTLGGTGFLLQPFGSSSGYPFVLTNEDFKLEVGEFNSPSFFVTFRSQGLWREPARSLHEKFLAWASGVGFSLEREERLSRVDFSFDYHLPQVDFDQDSFVTWSSKDSQHREDRVIQTFTFGRGDVVLRVYDKVAEIRQESGKAWFYPLWGQREHVWRIEWQVRKGLLRSFGIQTFEELEAKRGRVLRFLVEEHDTLRSPTEDSNRSRWPLHPLWQDLHERVRELDSLSSGSIDGKAMALEERMMRMTISIYGYLKRLAAVGAAQSGRSMLSLDEVLRALSDRLNSLHDPLSWELDVRKRLKAIELGEW
jgi:hypothetical protein